MALEELSRTEEIMTSHRFIAGLSRRAFLALAALLTGLSGVPALTSLPFAGPAHAQTATADPLSSWNNGPTKQAIVDFVRVTTDPANPNFVAPEDRIATFDLDGTLWVEHPMYTQVIYAFDRVPVVVKAKPELATVEPFKTILSGDRAAIAKLPAKDIETIFAATFSGMSVEAFRAETNKWLETAQHPRWKRPYTELAYQPMQEAINYLRAKGYRTYIVTGSGQDFVRVFAERGVRDSARTGDRHGGRHEIWLRRGRQAVPHHRAEAPARRQLQRQAGGSRPGPAQHQSRLFPAGTVRRSEKTGLDGHQHQERLEACLCIRIACAERIRS
jgi:phosphoserine phosphatase